MSENDLLRFEEEETESKGLENLRGLVTSELAIRAQGGTEVAELFTTD